MVSGHVHRFNCESCLFIDVRQLHREGRLSCHQSFPMAWKLGDESCGDILIRTEFDLVILRYQWKDAQDNSRWKLVEQEVPIAWTACALGGQRPWFVCNVFKSGVRCQRRAAKIYLGATPVFACRKCLCLSYASQNKTTRLRLISKAMKIRMRLGGNPNLCTPFPERPKGLHRSSYERLRKIHDDTDSRLS
jgi:hypothetical protein